MKYVLYKKEGNTTLLIGMILFIFNRYAPYLQTYRQIMKKLVNLTNRVLTVLYVKVKISLNLNLLRIRVGNREGINSGREGSRE